jgi:hypothetical protein
MQLFKTFTSFSRKRLLDPHRARYLYLCMRMLARILMDALIPGTEPTQTHLPHTSIRAGVQYTLSAM